MTTTILIGIGVPASLLFAGAAVLFIKRQTVSSSLQLLGAGCLIVVVLVHVAEALDVYGDAVGVTTKPWPLC